MKCLFKVITFVCFLSAFSMAEAKSSRTIRLNDKRTESIFVRPGHSTILNLPSRPTKVVLGDKSLFTVQYIENDLAVSALSSIGRSNLFIYLEGRRFGFDLKATSQEGDEIVLIRDHDEEKWKVKVKVNE